MVFFGSLGLTGLMGQEFNDPGDQGEFQVMLELPAGTSLAEMDRVTRQAEAAIRTEREVRNLTTTVGPDETSNTANIRVRLTPKTARTRTITEIRERLRPLLAVAPGLTVTLREPDLGGGSSSLNQAPITIIVRGPRYDELGRFAQGVYETVRTTHGVRDPASSYRPGRVEQNLVIARARAADMGVSYGAVATTLRTASEGEAVAKFRQAEHDHDVRVRLRADDRRSLTDLLAVQVPAPPGRVVYLRDVVTPVRATAPGTIDRLNRERQITITANITGRSLGEAVTDIQARLERLPHAPGYTYEFGGQAKQMNETFASLGLALALSILFVYFVLASQFESFLHPFTIMLSLPLAIVGALTSLFLSGNVLGMPAMIGIILLMGLVTKNAILLVDHANQGRDQGRTVIEALLDAGGTRLRPILMTSAAMVLGMLPTAIGKGEGSEFRAPMSIAVIGGVITSTVLTLVVVPVVYVWVDRFTIRGRRERRAANADQDVQPR